MIISENQIAALISMAHGYMMMLSNRNLDKAAQNIAALLDEISSQQSTELKEIK